MNKIDALLRPFNSRAAIFALLGLGILYVIPAIDKALNPASDAPGIFTYAGVAVTLTLLTAFTLYFGLKSDLGLPRKFILFAVLYNVCFIVVKFGLALSTTYNPFTLKANYSYMGGAADFRGAAPVIAVITFCLYLVAFLGVTGAKWRYVSNAVKSDSIQPDPELAVRSNVWVKVVAVLSGIAVGFVMFVVGGIALLIVAWFTGALDYFMSLLSPTLGLAIALALLATLLFLDRAFSTVAERAIAVRDVAILTSVIWIGIAFLVAFHALWIVYILTVASIWPLRLLVPK